MWLGVAVGGRFFRGARVTRARRRARGSTVTLPAGRSIPANGSCTLSVAVTAALAGSYVNTLAVGALVTSNGNNAASAVATLTVLNVGTPPAPSVPIPTLSEQTLMLLAAFLGIAAFAAMRRRAR